MPMRRSCSTTCIGGTSSPTGAAATRSPSTSSTDSSASSCSRRAAAGCRRRSAARRSTAPAASSSRAPTSTPPPRCTSRRRPGPRWSASRCTRDARCSRKAARRRSRDWVAALPPDVRAGEPRLTLAEAYAQLHADPNRAKALLARAFEGFAARNDARRQLLTAAAAVECHYYEWADFAPLDRWIAEFERLLEPRPALPVHRRRAAHPQRAAHRAPVPAAGASAASRRRRRCSTRCWPRPTSRRCR